MKNNNVLKFIVLTIVCLLVGVSVGLLSYHYFLKPQLEVYEGFTQNNVSLGNVSSNSQFTKIRPTKQSYIEVCKEKAKEYIENLRLKSSVDFNYNILEVKEFLTPEDAEAFAKNKVSIFSNYEICREKNIGSTLVPNFVPIELPSKIIVIIYEVRYTTPSYICIYGSCGTIEKFTDVIYCGDDGRILEKGVTSSCW